MPRKKPRLAPHAVQAEERPQEHAEEKILQMKKKVEGSSKITEEVMKHEAVI